MVVEDDAHIAELLDMYLRQEGFRVLQATAGERGLELVKQERPRLVILDVGLPGALDGFEVCRRIRADSNIPVLMLTARDTEVDRVVGLEIGADDYVTKPFSPREIVARVRAILRRSDAPSVAGKVLPLGDLEIDMGRREVRRAGEAIQLAAREFDLLAYFVQHPRLALSRQQLLDGVWGPGWYGDDRTVDVHVRQLRKKLGDSLSLTTVWGTGYRLD